MKEEEEESEEVVEGKARGNYRGSLDVHAKAKKRVGPARGTINENKKGH